MASTRRTVRLSKTHTTGACKAIAQHVAREEARESFRQEAMAAWTADQETGRHLTGQEVRTWLDAWGTAAETALPECHA